MTKIAPDYVFNIKLKYKLGYYPFVAISPAGSDLCAIRRVSLDPDCWLYGWEDGQGHPLEKSDYEEPLLHIEESRDLNSGQLTHLIFTIQKWDGNFIGQVLWGSNEYEIWTKSELEGIPPGLMVGKKRAISINLISDPTITGVEPPPPPPGPSLWARIPWYFKMSMAAIFLIATWGLVTRKK